MSSHWVMVTMQSSDVNVSPLLNLIPLRTLNVHVLRSSLALQLSQRQGRAILSRPVKFLYSKIIRIEKASLDKIHSHSLEILRDVGIRFPNAEALGLFKKQGFKVKGSMLHFEEKDIQQAPATVPAAFTISARNPSRNIRIGEAYYAMAPGYGPPFIIEPSGKKELPVRLV